MIIVIFNADSYVLAKDLDCLEPWGYRGIDFNLATYYHHAEALMILLEIAMVYSLACLVVLRATDSVFVYSLSHNGNALMF